LTNWRKLEIICLRHSGEVENPGKSTDVGSRLHADGNVGFL